MAVDDLAPDGTPVPAIPEDESDPFDPFAGMTAEQLIEEAASLDDPAEAWQRMRAAVAAEFAPNAPAAVEDVLAALPSVAQFDKICHEAMGLVERKRKALAHADRFEHKDAQDAARAKIMVEAAHEAVEIYRQGEELLQDTLKFGRPGAKMNGVTGSVLQAADFVYRWLSPPDAIMWTEGVAVAYPVIFAEYVEPAAERIIRRPPNHFKGWEKNFQAALDRHPVVDRYRLQADLQEHVQLARKVLVGLLNAYVAEDGTRRPMGGAR
jgi:hypothetical protein